MPARPAALHILSDWKWTGPAEPVANLCRGLRRMGFAVRLACIAAPPGETRTLEHEARKRQMDPILDLSLDKRPNFLINWRDIRHLAEIIDHEEFSIVHVHTSHDTYIGSRAARRANNRPYVVRTNHTGVPLKACLFARRLMRGRVAGWVAYSESCLRADCRAFRIPDQNGVAVEGAVDLERFHPGINGQAKRAEFGFTPEHVVFGVVARIQRHRRFGVLLQALRNAISRNPRVRGLILGRGTRQVELVDRPIEEMGLAGLVVHPGYRIDDYEPCLAAMDAQIFLVPGSDGSCRAAREAMAIGRPVIASERGLLPELVRNEHAGLVIDDTVENLTQAILRLAEDADLRGRLGAAAAESAAARFRIEDQAQAVGDLYMRLATRPV